MKFNIGAEDAKFIVNEEKKIVVCIIENTQDLFINFANENFHLSSECDMHFALIQSRKYDLSDKLKMPNKFVGIATCGPDDEWDEHIGCVIAFSRAKDNLLKSFFKRAQTYVTSINNWLDEAVDIINNLGVKLMDNNEHRYAYIDKLIDGNAINN